MPARSFRSVFCPLFVCICAALAATGCRGGDATRSESESDRGPAASSASIETSQRPPRSEHKAIGDGGPNCSGAGDPSVVGVDGGATCTGSLAQSTFRYAVCSCNSFSASAHFATDGFDSTKGPPNGGLGGNVGSDSAEAWSAHVTIGGDLVSPASLQAAAASEIRGNLLLGGQLTAGAPFTVDGNAQVVRALPRNVNVHGTVSHVSSIAPPCDCSNLIPIASDIAAHRPPANDNAAIGLSPGAAIGSHLGQIDLPCGNYYLSGINASAGPLTIFAHGHTALYIDGDVTASTPLSFELDPTATFDVFIGGNVDTSAHFTFGSTSNPAHCRAYVAGAALNMSAATTIGCNIYAPTASFNTSASGDVYGALFVGGFAASANATVHYDTSIQTAGGECCTPALCDDGNPCTADACNADGTCRHTPLANGSACSGSNKCDVYACQSGACTGAPSVTCGASDQCHVVGTCDPTTGACSNPSAPDGTGCNDGNACTRTDACQGGTCVGSNPVSCTASDQCHAVGTCNTSTGVCSSPALANGTTCDDGNACTQSDACQSGVCTGSNPVACVAADQCHVAGACDPTSGLCSNPAAPSGTACNDGNACTQSDTCQAGACIGSNPVVCVASDSCHAVGACDPTTGACSNPPAPNGTACSGSNKCDRYACQNGACTGTPAVTCTASDQCHAVGTCDPASGSCTNPNAPDGTACTGTNKCNQAYACMAGTCTGSNPVVCTASDQCHTAGVCDPGSGSCSTPTASDGTACNDGDACTQTDACQAGVCTGSNPVTCAPADACHQPGTCDPSSGVCSNPIAPDGTACAGTNKCNQSYTCQSGACTGSNPVTCIASDVCHVAGMCDPTTGACSNPPAADGTVCGNIDASSSMSCSAGACTCSAGQTACSGTCVNTQSDPNNCGGCGNVCPPGSSCAGGSAQVVGTFYVTERNNQGVARVTVDVAGNVAVTPGFVSGLPLDGPDSIIFDHHGRMLVSNTEAGTLSLIDPTTGMIVDLMVNNVILSGVADLALDPLSDRAWSISYDGSGPEAIAATDLDTGAVVFRNPDNVSNLGGIAFNSSGTRLFVSSHDGPIVELDPSSGHLIQSLQLTGQPDGMTYDSSTGHLFVSGLNGGLAEVAVGTAIGSTMSLVHTYDPASDGIAADGRGHVFLVGGSSTLSVLDTSSGQVSVIANHIPSADDVAPVVGVGAPPPCSPSAVDAGAADSGVDAGLCAASPDGTPCDDGNVCTQTDSCQHGACIGSNPVVCVARDQCHAPGVCDPVAGTCTNPAAGDGTACNDGNACTQTDSCQGGVCVGSNPVACSATDECHAVGTCDPSTGTCSNPINPDGTSCCESDAGAPTPAQAPSPLFDRILSVTSFSGGAGQVYELGSGGTKSLFATVNAGGWVGPLRITASGRVWVVTSALGGSLWDITPGGDLTGAAPLVQNLFTNGGFIDGFDLDDQGNAYVAYSEFGLQPLAVVSPTGIATYTPTKYDNPAALLVAPRQSCSAARSLYISEGNTGRVLLRDLDAGTDTVFASGFNRAPTHVSAQLALDPLGQLFVLWSTSAGTGLFNITAGGNFAGVAPLVAAPFRIDVNECAFNSGASIFCAGNATDNVYVSTRSGGTQQPFTVFQGGLGDNESIAVGPPPGPTGGSSGDICKSGVCAPACPTGQILCGGACITCAPQDQCHMAGTCDPGTGTCTNPAAPDGVACVGSNSCNHAYACLGGACTGSDPVVCVASDKCHLPGTCDQATGLCSNPAAPDGTSCGDVDAGSSTLLCKAGACTCPAGQTMCGASCVDTRSDPNNCGGCGNTCSGGNACSSGNCVELPAAGACQSAGSLALWVNGTHVVSYVPRGSWFDQVHTGLSLVNIEGNSASPTFIPTPSAVNSCASHPTTGQTVCTADTADVYVLNGNAITQQLTSAAISVVDFSGGECTNCGVTMDPSRNRALISVALPGTQPPGSQSWGYQFLNLGTSPAFDTPFETFPEMISEGPLVDPIRGLILSPAEDHAFELINIGDPSGLSFFDKDLSGWHLDAALEDCSTGIILATTEQGAGNVFIADLSQATFTPGNPPGCRASLNTTCGATWSAPSQMQSLVDSSNLNGFSMGGGAVAQGTHIGILAGEFEDGSNVTAIRLPEKAGTGVPSVTDWVSCKLWGIRGGFDPHTVGAYRSPNGGDAIGVLANEVVVDDRVFGTNALAVVDLTKMLDPTIVPRTPGGHACATSYQPGLPQGSLPSSLVRLVSVPSPPIVQVAPNFVLFTPVNRYSLTATVYDADDATTATWVQVSGPPVTFDSSTAPLAPPKDFAKTTVSFPSAAVGTYVLRVTVTDSTGLSASADVTITVIANPCDAGLTYCNGACADFTSDPQNCGACGNACQIGFSCSVGTCLSASEAGAADASGQGLDASTLDAAGELDGFGAGESDGATSGVDVGVAEASASDDGGGISPDATESDALEESATDSTVPDAGTSDAGGLLDAPATDSTVGPPVVSLAAPLDGADVTQPTDVVGSVSAGDWRLEYSAGDLATAANPTWILLQSGTGTVTNGVLGQFDPTLLFNGSYILRLTAVAGGQSAQTSIGVSVFGSMKMGIFTLSFTDMQVALGSLPIVIQRTYDSRRKSSEDFGVGWSLNIANAQVSKTDAFDADWTETVETGLLPTYCLTPAKSHIVIIAFPGGRVYRFRQHFATDCQSVTPFETATVTFDPMPGTQGTLQVANADVLVTGGPGGAVQLLDASDLSPFDPTGFQLTTKDGYTYLVGPGGVEGIIDRNNNSLSLGPSGIVSSTGKGVGFTRDSSNRITLITDPAGNSLSYAYDSAGNLQSVVDRDGNQTSFSYDNHHRLLSVVDPLGNTGLRSTFDADGRLLAVTDAAGKATTFSHDMAGQRELITDRRGNVTTLTFNSQGLLSSRTDPSGATSSYTYDADGNLLSETDPLGQTLSYSYDKLDNQMSATDALGNTTQRTFNSLGLPLTLQDANGHTTTFSYDANGNRTGYIDALGHTTSMQYDGSGNRIAETDPAGNVTKYSYDANNLLLAITDAQGGVRQKAYDANGRLTGETDALGNSFTYSYNANGLPTSVNMSGSVRKSSYDAAGNIIGLVDPLGRSTQLVRDALGRAVATVFPDGAQATNSYDAEGSLSAHSDLLGNVTSYQNDANGRLVSITHPDGTTQQSVYDSAGNLVQEIDALGHATTHQFDAAGHEVRVTDAMGNVTSKAYDAVGNVVSMTDPLGRITSFEYDAVNRPVRTTFADGTTEVHTYDAVGKEIQWLDRAGNKTVFSYDSMRRLTRTVDALGNVTSYSYDALGRRTAEMDPNGHTTSYAYDALGRMLGIVYPLGDGEATAYNLDGSVASRTNGNGDVVSYVYDNRKHLVDTVLPGPLHETRTYASDGKLLTITDARGTTQYVYDAVTRRVVRVTEPDGRYVRYEYDSAGNRMVIAHAMHVGDTEDVTHYQYDALSRIAQVIDPAGHTTQYAYDAAGNRTDIARGNGTTTSLTYDSMNRPAFIAHLASDGAVLGSFAYSVDANGNRVRETREDGSHVDYAYDAIGRVVSEARFDASAVIASQTAYGYDSAGNLATQVVNGVSTAFAYNGDSQMVSGGGTTYAFDGAGDLVSATKGNVVTRYTYDSRGRMTSVLSPDGTLTQFGYDSDGVRQTKDNPGTHVQYLIDRYSATGVPQVVRETDAVGATLSSYVHGTELLERNLAGALSFYHQDGLGSTRAVTDVKGQSVETDTYSAYGTLTAQTGSGENAYLFAGQQRDAETGLYYMRARYYDAIHGKFIERDRARKHEGRYPADNAFAYSSDNPVNRVDPAGLEDGDIVAILRAELGIRPPGPPAAYGGDDIAQVAGDFDSIFAELLTVNTLNALDDDGSNGAFTFAFGEDHSNGGKHDTVRTRLNGILGALAAPIKFETDKVDEDGNHPCKPNDIAITVLPVDHPPVVILCPLFTVQNTYDLSTKAGALLHEAYHIGFGRTNGVELYDDAAILFATQSSQVVSNAANYAIFAEELENSGVWSAPYQNGTLDSILAPIR